MKLTEPGRHIMGKAKFLAVGELWEGLFNLLQA